WPKRHVKPEYIAWRFRLADGRTIQGYRRSESAGAIEVFDPAAQQTLSLAKADIEEQAEAGTLMPDGLAAAMSDGQRRDVMRLLLDLGRVPGLEKHVSPAPAPAAFVYDR